MNTCPKCKGKAVTRQGRFGEFTPCENWSQKCDMILNRFGWSDQATRDARKQAHATFDLLWTNGGERRRQYHNLAQALHVQKSMCHIEAFSIEQCREVQRYAIRSLRRKEIRCKRQRRALNSR